MTGQTASLTDLSGSKIAITGGAGDIGRAMARELAGRGADVTLLDLAAPDAAAEWLAPFGSLPGAVRYRQADVRDSGGLSAALAEIGGLDVAIGNAGIVRSAPFLEITQEHWQTHLDVNLTGAFNLTQAAARQMAKAGTRGLVLLTGSWVGSVPWPEIAAYSATKAGLEMLARSAARELAPHGIRVNVLAPGIVKAGLAAHQYATEPQYRERVSRVIPLREMQTAEQVARVAGFLCSGAGDYLTGTVLLADGGCSLFQFD
ncbi:SDR family NAD(P)-dependent oxidoreductase [Nonomuraea lactucae]|uniref:SDR family NAD(P)-dependent oxidoreductase n=1 Tax=Nonomuraea lactucae TaxID=2249762 RepID=UPI000DE452AA|nr:SDR family oxidoreductase [Nonomuraea lactucae]